MLFSPPKKWFEGCTSQSQMRSGIRPRRAKRDEEGLPEAEAKASRLPNLQPMTQSPLLHVVDAHPDSRESHPVPVWPRCAGRNGFRVGIGIGISRSTFLIVRPSRPLMRS